MNIILRCSSVPSASAPTAVEPRAFFHPRPATYSAALDAAEKLFPHLGSSSVYLSRTVEGVGVVRYTEGACAAGEGEAGEKVVYDVGAYQFIEEIEPELASSEKVQQTGASCLNRLKWVGIPEDRSDGGNRNRESRLSNLAVYGRVPRRG
ncbi:hypothetical protein JCM11641_001654 [Rhodosporidiobolus odoratus]